MGEKTLSQHHRFGNLTLGVVGSFKEKIPKHPGGFPLEEKTQKFFPPKEQGSG